MTIREAIISVPHAEYTNPGVEEFVSLCREAGLTNIRETACRESGCTIEITVESPLAESELDALEYIDWWERLDNSSDEVKYLCKLVVPAPDDSIEPAPLVLPSYHEMEASSDDLQVDDDSLLISLVGSQEAILEGIRMYEDAGMNVLLQKITDYNGSADILDPLTERQKEILHTAYDLGYFDVPRRSSAADIAKELDLDASTVSEHLQRAQHNLLTPLLETGGSTG